MQKIFTKLLALFALVAVSAVTAKAEQFPTDGSPITSGTDYEVTAFHDYRATFTPSTSGTLIQDGCPELKLDKGTATFMGYGGKFGRTFTWQVEAGVTYTISNHVAILDNGPVCFTMENEVGVQILSIDPEEGSVISPLVNLTGDILFNFNTGVLIDDAFVVKGSEQISLMNVSMQPNTIALRLKDALVSMYSSGILKREGGEEFSIEIYGLKSLAGALFNGDGHISVKYISSPQLTDLVSDNVPRMLKSFYPEGDPEGIWTFVFDRDIINDGSVWLDIICGNPMSDGTYYNEILMPQINGATLTFDLTNKLRELEDYLMYQGNDYVAVKLNNVRDIYGNPALGSGDGNVASYSYSLPYKYLRPANIVCEFDPPTGSSLNGVDEIEIWYNNADMIEFDGVEFNYHTDAGFETAVVLKSELSTSLENNEMTIKCKVPDVVKGHDQITVRLYNMQSIDGYNYRIQGLYDMFVVDLLSPIRPGQTIASTGFDDFVFTINLTTRYFYLRYDFYNAEGPEGWVYGSELHQQSNGTWVGFNGDFPCYNNFNPYIIVSAYYTENDFNNGDAPAETFKFSFVGTTPPFTYSDVKFVSIDPQPSSEIIPAEDFCFTVVYDGLVNIDALASGVILGMGMGVEPFARVVPEYASDDYIEGYANIWKLYPNLSTLENSEFIDISIFAKDELGGIVEGNLGAGEFDCLQFSYSVYSAGNYLPLDVTPADFSELDSLSQFVISCPGLDVDINYSYTGDVKPRLLDQNWEVIREFEQADFVKEVNEYALTVLKLAFDTIITKGDYIFFIPEDYIIMGDQFDVHGNASYFGTYIITGKLDGVITIINDADSQDVYNIQGMHIDGKNLKPGLYIINGQKVYIK